MTEQTRQRHEEIFGMEGRHEGREAIVNWVRTGVATFDRNGGVRESLVSQRGE
jgi:hypothetical protein